MWYAIVAAIAAWFGYAWGSGERPRSPEENPLNKVIHRELSPGQHEWQCGSCRIWTTGGVVQQFGAHMHYICFKCRREDKVPDDTKKEAAPTELELSPMEIYILEAALNTIKPYTTDLWAKLNSSGTQQRIYSAEFVPVHNKILEIAKQLREGDDKAFVTTADDYETWC